MTPIRVLLVEDHRDTADVLARLLREDRYRVAVAYTLADATRLCAEQLFDVLICNLELPDVEAAAAHLACRDPVTLAAL